MATANDAKNLIIHNISAAAGGRYSCEAVNEVGVARADFDIEVLVHPRIVEPKVPLTEVRVREGNRTQLHCRTEGNPKPNIKVCFFLPSLFFSLLLISIPNLPKFNHQLQYICAFVASVNKYAKMKCL